ncbi:DUF7282 domain-containing protein [Haloglomus litoreum]|uniref:DUF7282 domain-containing protein n=1 Tax=Haloglomus litoreum TaxID=3034026 RepID=UPI0023E80DFB|nr:BGTF surface domain-containing protein [Haloglomus sp. DT116]
MTGTYDKLRGVTLAVLMVLSVFAGTVAFAGTAAAASNAQFDTEGTIGNGSDNAPAGSVSGLTSGVGVDNNQNIQQIRISFSAGSFDGSFNDVPDDDVNIRVYPNQAAYESGNTALATTTFNNDATVESTQDNGETITVQTSSSFSLSPGQYVEVDIEDNFLNPSSGGDYEGDIILQPQSDANTATGTLSVPATGDDDDDDEVEEPDNFWDDRATRFQGQQLDFNPNGATNADYQLYECDYDATTETCEGDLVQDLPDDGPFEIDTTDLQGDYVIAINGGETYIITNETGFRSGTQNAADGPTDPSTSIVTQTLDASFDDDRISQGSSSTLSVKSPKRGNYQLVIGADGLSQGELDDLFDNSGTISGDDENVTVQVDSTDDNIDVSVPSSFDTGEYDFQFNVRDTTASDTDSVEIVTEADTTATFEQNSYVEDRGDEVTISLELSNTESTTVRIGSDEVNYVSNVRVRDSDDDGDVSFTMNTFRAGQASFSESSAFSSEDDTVSFARRQTDGLESPLEATDYDLTALVDNNEVDVAVLDLRERSQSGISIYTAPSRLSSTADAGSAYSDANDVRDAATQRRVIADGNHFILQINASGLGGYVEDIDDFEDTKDGEDATQNVALYLEDAEAGPNADAPNFTIANGEVYPDGDNDTYYVVFDPDSYGDDFEDGERYRLTFTVPESNPYIGNDNANRDESVSFNKTFRLDEREATFDTGDNSVVTVEAASGETISGTTNVAPGTEFDIRAKATGQGAFLLTQPTEVAKNGSFSAEFDFSNVSENTSFTLTIPSQNFEDNAETPARVGAAETASATFNNQTFTGQATSVEVEQVTTSDGGFVTIHDSTLVSDGAVFDSVRGTSAYLAPGTQTNVTVELDSPIAPSGSGTYYAMPHLDSDGDQTYDFVTSEGADDGPYTTNEGNAVVDPATITVERVATVTFNDQQQMGDTVLVESVRLPNGGFVTIHDSTVADDPFGSVRGTSNYLESGTSADINITLDEPASESGQFFAMPHRDTDGDETYDFVSSNGDDDGPYLNADGQIVLDAAQIQVGGMDTPTDTPTETDEPDTPTETDEPDTPTETDEPETTTTSGGQPGFGLAVSLIALVGAALIALRRRD